MRNPDAEPKSTPPLDDDEQLRKDLSYSPASEAETAAKQQATAQPRDGSIEADAVRVLPGTGGPDDAGDVEVEGEPLRLPQHRELGTAGSDPEQE